MRQGDTGMQKGVNNITIPESCITIAGSHSDTFIGVLWDSTQSALHQFKIIMTTAKNLGIWMDHASAHLSEFTTDPIETKIISSRFTHQEKEQSLHKSENLMHNKEQHEQLAYYKQLAEVIKNYEDVILFGPTDAKVELLNLLRADHRFEKIKIEIKQTDKMSENQQHAFVREHFSRH
jgi:hypothetical protein